MAKAKVKKKIVVRRPAKSVGRVAPKKRSVQTEQQASKAKRKVASRTTKKGKPAPKAPRRAKKSARSKRASILSAEDRKNIRNLLIRLKELAAGQINFLAADNLSRTQDDAVPDFRSEEQGTDNFERDIALSRVGVRQNVIFQIDQALHRIEQGKYGVCESCQKHIEKARLMALPYSRLCIACQSATERGGKAWRAPSTPVFKETEIMGLEQESDDE